MSSHEWFDPSFDDGVGRDQYNPDLYDPILYDLAQKALSRLADYSQGVCSPFNDSSTTEYDNPVCGDFAVEHIMSREPHISKVMVKDNNLRIPIGQDIETQLQIFSAIFTNINEDLMVSDLLPDYIVGIISAAVSAVHQQQQLQAGNTILRIELDEAKLRNVVTEKWLTFKQERISRSPLIIYEMDVRGTAIQIVCVYDKALLSWSIGYQLVANRCLYVQRNGASYETINEPNKCTHIIADPIGPADPPYAPVQFAVVE